MWSSNYNTEPSEVKKVKNENEADREGVYQETYEPHGEEGRPEAEDVDMDTPADNPFSGKLGERDDLPEPEGVNRDTPADNPFSGKLGERNDLPKPESDSNVNRRKGDDLGLNQDEGNSVFREEPREVSTGVQNLNLGEWSLVGYYKYYGIVYYVQKFAPRSHAYYRVVTELPAGSSKKISQAKNLALEGKSIIHEEGAERNKYTRKEFLHVEAVAWLTDFTEIPPDAFDDGLPAILDAELQQIRPDKPRKGSRQLCMALLVWNHIEVINGEQTETRVYGWEPRSHIPCDKKPKATHQRYIFWNAAVRCVNDYKLFLKKKNIARSVTPQLYLTGMEMYAPKERKGGSKGNRNTAKEESSVVGSDDDSTYSERVRLRPKHGSQYVERKSGSKGNRNTAKEESSVVGSDDDSIYSERVRLRPKHGPQYAERSSPPRPKSAGRSPRAESKRMDNDTHDLSSNTDSENDGNSRSKKTRVKDERERTSDRIDRLENSLEDVQLQLTRITKSFADLNETMAQFMKETTKRNKRSRR